MKMYHTGKVQMKFDQIVKNNLNFSKTLYNLNPQFTEVQLTRLLGRFAPLFYFNCDHVLFVNIVKQKNPKNFADFIKNLVDFQNFQKSTFVSGKFLKIRLSFMNIPWGRQTSIFSLQAVFKYIDVEAFTRTCQSSVILPLHLI